MQVNVHCPTCVKDESLEIPDDFSGLLRWEHGCPPQDDQGNTQGAYKGTVQIGDSAPTSFPEVPDGVTAVRDDDVGQAQDTHA